MEELREVHVSELLTFKSIDHYSFCIRFQTVDGTLYCDIYTATSEILEKDSHIEELFNLVDIDGNAVDDFKHACRILSIVDIMYIDGQLFFSLGFNGDYYMNYSELEAIHDLIEEYVKPQLVKYMES